MTVTPFLRSPPFPGISPALAAISTPLVDGESPSPVSDSLLDALIESQVGGAFWGHRPAAVCVVVRQGIPVAPDILAGRARQEVGIMPRGDGKGRSIAHIDDRVLPDPCDPWALVAGAASVHAAVDDDLAIVAGLLGVPVFGPDLLPIAPDLLRSAAVTRIATARYRDCFSGETVDAEAAVAQLADWRRHIDGNRGIAAASGMAFWKREAIRHFLWDGLRSPPFLSAERGLRRARQEGGALAVWPSRVPPSTARDAASVNVPLARVEDGFLRSRGLGAALHPPGSVVVDRSGIYYNARAANDLESLLASHPFPPHLVERAQRLRRRICATGVTKYGAGVGEMIGLPPGRRTVLAVGQV
ncbi:MAG: beta-3-deoxy-D-manno-oct-2-ulosonic acid transferase, partial [bacterium]|nr:beta-3-deoxy-D-manno-oct-2-ulosonic acid transferase [bacterium]